MIELKKRKKLVIIGLVFLLMATISIYNLINEKVTITIDDKVTAFKVTDSTVRELLYDNGIELKDEDYINTSLDKDVEEGMNIIIKKAVPIFVNAGGKKMQINTTANNVEEVIQSLDIDVDDNDKINPPLENNITSNLEINIVKVEEKVEKIIDMIPYSIIEEYNNNLFKGDSIVIQPGAKGLVEYKVKKIYEDNKLLDEKIIDSYLVKEPVNSVIERGTKDYLVSSRGKLEYKDTMTMVASAYDLSYESTGKTSGDKNFGITASGTKVRPGVIAVDPNVIPLGTRLYIESLDGWPDYGFAVAEDTGGAIRGNRIDLYMESRSKALDFGRRKVKVYILDN
ncbi:3D domain-containing protein [Sporosalibacterium faouarense]|uniref:3D domain-containing protein n=1 Tax=Sporosalibacterium faouarense TaxID=516123 RepID=UPI00141CB564|nr:3D domain-containing protein [Sporosalibacterium faouarense]MTI48827.1 DUF348 domain-containing protein [Bacillota bacterium]